MMAAMTRPLALLLTTFLAAAPVSADPAARPATMPAPMTRPATRPAELSAAVGEILNRMAETGATVSYRVIDADTGEVLAEQEPDRPMIPASNMKLPISAAALDKFGGEGDNPLVTKLAVMGDDLVVIGSGDPAVGDPTLAEQAGETIYAPFDAFAEALKARGTTHFAGDLIYDARALGEPRVHPTWDRDDLIYWYAAPVSGLNFNDNTIDVAAEPAEMGEPARLEIEPKTSETVHVVNLTRTTEETGAEVDIEKTHIANVYAVVGDVHKRREFIARPVGDPGRFFADVLKTRLAEKGVTIDGELVEATGDMDLSSAEVVAEHVTPLDGVMNRINVNSQNMFAEAMCRLLGQADSGEATWEAGEAAVAKFLDSQGIVPAGFHAEDGSGLSRQNRVTVRQLSELLRAMKSHPNGQIFFDSLAVGGESGTLASRFKDADGRVRGKTGYIGGVRALTVHLTTDAGRELIASILYNNVPGSVRPYQNLQDEAVMYLLRDGESEE